MPVNALCRAAREGCVVRHTEQSAVSRQLSVVSMRVSESVTRGITATDMLFLVAATPFDRGRTVTSGSATGNMSLVALNEPHPVRNIKRNTQNLPTIFIVPLPIDSFPYLVAVNTFHQFHGL